LFDSNNVEILLLNAEFKLKEITGAQKCYIFLLERQKYNNYFLYRYESNRTITIPYSSSGILFSAVDRGEILEHYEPTNEPLFNPTVDIQTKFPLLTIPVFDKEERVIAVI
jgi:hypothetical protein